MCYPEAEPERQNPGRLVHLSAKLTAAALIEGLLASIRPVAFGRGMQPGRPYLSSSAVHLTYIPAARPRRNV